MESLLHCDDVNKKWIDGLNKIRSNQVIRYQPIITAKIPHNYYTIFCYTKEAQSPIVERFFKEKHPQISA